MVVNFWHTILFVVVVFLLLAVAMWLLLVLCSWLSVKGDDSNQLRGNERQLESAVPVNHLYSLYPSKQIPYHWFGEAVMINENMAIVGAPGSEDYSNYGVAYIYHRKGVGKKWEEVAQLEPPTKGVYASFGAAVSIYQGCALVGAPKDDSGGTDSGAVYYYADSSGGAGNWRVQQALKPSDLTMQDHFGYSIAQDKCRHAVVGAWGADSSSYVSMGAAYIYIFSSGSWQLEKKLTPGDGSSSYQWFGISVGMAENLAVVGAWGAKNQAGTVYIYRYTDGGGWHYVQNLYGSNGGNFGYSLAVHGGVLVVGSPNSYRTSLGASNNPNAIRTGLVSVYRMQDFNHFVFDQYIQCDQCGGVDRFGKALAVTTDTKYGYRILIGQKRQIHLFEYDSSRSSGYRWYSVGFVESGYDVDSSFFYGSAVAVYGKTMLLGVKDHSSQSSAKYSETGAVIVLDTDDHSDPDVDAIENSFHVTLYICLYASIVLGIAVILLVPLGMFIRYIFDDPEVTKAAKDKNRLREKRPFLDIDSSLSSSTSSTLKNKIKGSLH